MKFFRILTGVVVVVGLSCLVMAINAAQMFSIVLLLVSREQFMRFNMGCQNFFAWGNVIGAKICKNEIITSGDLPTSENALVMANHQAMTDIPALWIWGYPCGASGWMKWFVKDSFKYVPGPGWGLKFLHALLVKRDWSKDADSIRKTFRVLSEEEIPFWVMIFPEGTRMKPAKYASSRAYAARRGLPVFDRVLVPRPKGVWSSIQGLKGKLKCIYDVTIAYESVDVPLIMKFFCLGHHRVHVHMVRIPIESVPTSEREFNQWMMDRFVAKDLWMKDFAHRVAKP